VAPRATTAIGSTGYATNTGAGGLPFFLRDDDHDTF
jgi:hypothetical protein